MRKLTHDEILKRQAQESGAKIPLTVVVNNVRSLYNVGALFRTADGAGVEKIWLCGITGIPPSEKITKTALDAEKSVPWEYAESASEVIRILKQEGYEIVLLEQTDCSLAHSEYRPKGPVCLVLGNEIEGVDEALVQLADRALEIEMAGLKNSLNVAVAFAVIAYHVRSQFKKVPST